MKKATKILVVDDDARTLYGLVSRLEQDGLDTQYESTGEMAIHSLNADIFDICLFNTVLPDMSGFDLLMSAKQLNPVTKVIMMTSSLVSENIRFALEKGAYYFITKPVSPSYLKDIINRAINSRNNKEQEGEAQREFLRSSWDDGVDITLSMVTKCYDGSSYLGAKCHIKARAIDLSDGGVGVISRFFLEKDQNVVFQGKLHNKSGIVRWCSKLDAQTYRAGIKFV